MAVRRGRRTTGTGSGRARGSPPPPRGRASGRIAASRSSGRRAGAGVGAGVGAGAGEREGGGRVSDTRGRTTRAGAARRPESRGAGPSAVRRRGAARDGGGAVGRERGGGGYGPYPPFGAHGPYPPCGVPVPPGRTGRAGRVPYGRNSPKVLNGSRIRSPGARADGNLAAVARGAVPADAGCGGHATGRGRAVAGSDRAPAGSRRTADGTAAGGAAPGAGRRFVAYRAGPWTHAYEGPPEAGPPGSPGPPVPEVPDGNVLLRARGDRWASRVPPVR